jgi:multidrug transporter EmrE-like cation transporter
VPFAIVRRAAELAAWPYVLASVAIHIVYYLALAQAYRFGDLGQVYPIARGTAPLMTAVLATVWLGEGLGSYGWAGVIVLAAGILLLAFRGGRALERFDARSVGFALLTSLTITTYTLVDGVGARVSGSPLQYTVWLFVLSGAAMAIYGFARIGRRLVGDFATNWPLAIAGAALSTTAYGIAIWAMTVAPIALVAALRETSVLFARCWARCCCASPSCPRASSRRVPRSGRGRAGAAAVAPTCPSAARRVAAEDRAGGDGAGCGGNSARLGVGWALEHPRHAAEPLILLRQQAVMQLGPQRARGDVLDEHLGRRRHQECQHGGRAMAAEWPQCLCLPA